MTGRKPPKEYQWGPGESGNPGGRPRKDKDQSPKPPITLGALVIDEAYRPIEIRENGKTETIPMIKAVLRRLGVAGATGNLSAGKAILGLLQAIEQRRLDETLALVETVRQYKNDYARIFAEHDRAGRPRPDPVPHPDDIIIDRLTGVRFNGPTNDHHKGQWDEQLGFKAEHQATIEILKKKRRRRGRTPDERALLESQIQSLQDLVDVIDSTFPSEALRRSPGFDLAQWREQQKLVLDFKRKAPERPAERPKSGRQKRGPSRSVA